MKKMEWKINKQHEGMFIRDYLKTVHAFSKSIITAIKFDGGLICVNGIQQTVRYQLVAGDILTVQFPPETKGYYMTAEEIKLSILYEDEDIIVINKQPGIATAPSPLNPSGTIANGILAYYEKQGIPYTVHIVTRLDRDTSGLLLIAKHRYSHSLLGDIQSNGKIKRKYDAIVEGRIERKQGVIDAKIGRKEGSIIERTITHTGKSAVTNYEVKEEVNDYSLLKVELQTGRTHQIRVHFASIGYPLVGDNLYGGSLEKIARQALHCAELSFPHPLNKKNMKFTLSIPSDMKLLIS